MEMLLQEPESAALELDLEWEDVDCLFPCHLVVDINGRVVRLGPRLQELLPELAPGSSVAEHFSGATYATLLRGTFGGTTRLQASRAPLVLKGAVMAIESGLVLLAGSECDYQAQLRRQQEALDLYQQVLLQMPLGLQIWQNDNGTWKLRAANPAGAERLTGLETDTPMDVAAPSLCAPAIQQALRAALQTAQRQEVGDVTVIPIAPQQVALTFRR